MSATLAANATAGYAARRGLRLVASEPSGVYVSDRVASLAGAVDAFLAVSLDELDEVALQDEVRTIETAERRLKARKARAASVLADRHARRAAQANPDRPQRAAEEAARQVHDQLAGENGWSATEAKDNQRLGKVLDRSPRLAEAAQDGDIPAANATRLGRFLDRLSPAERDQVEGRLMEAARAQDPNSFRRTVDRVRGELRSADAVKEEERKRARRRGSLYETPDGMPAVHAEFDTVGGAIFHRAVHTYRRPDQPDEHRTPQQRTADALVDLARAALQEDGDSGSGPSRNHGTRPHVVVTIPIGVLLDGAGMVDIDGEPVPLDAIRHLMDDAGWSFVVTETHTKPLAVTGESRTVPAGLWRALTMRDGGCIHDSCDALVDWCDVMHLNVPHRNGGGLSLDNAGLGCRTHHRAYDNGRLELHWDDGKPILRPRGRPPDTRAGPAP